MSILRVFLAHPKAMEDEADLRWHVEQAQANIQRLQAKAGGRAVIEVTTGRDDFMQRVHTCGGWDAWAHSVGAGLTFRDGAAGQPTFDMIVVTPEQVISMGTVKILEAAFVARRPVFYMPGKDEPDSHLFYPVTGMFQRPKAERTFNNTHALRYGVSI